MKKILAILTLSLICLSAYTQSADDMKLISSIAEKSASIQSFSGKFKQTRTVTILNAPMVSTGEMQYRHDGRLLWKYTSPESYQIAFTSNEVKIHNATGDSVISLEDNPLMARLKDMLLGIMSGSGISAPEGFDVNVSRSENYVTIDMLPSSRTTRKLFKSMSMTFSAGDLVIEKVFMEEADGSSTSITFYDRIIK